MSRKKTKYNHDTPHKRISLYKLNDIMKEDEEYQTAMAGSWGGLFIFSLLFYFSGFRAATMYPLNGKFTAFIANADRLGIRFNFQYYGICRTDTFFDCPVLQWIMLLASLDAARANLDSPRGRKQIEKAISNAKYLRSEIDKMEHIHQLKSDFGYMTDVTKVFIKIDGLSGKRLESILEIDFNIEVESATDSGLLLLSNIGNKRSDIEYLQEVNHIFYIHTFGDIFNLNTDIYACVSLYKL